MSAAPAAVKASSASYSVEATTRLAPALDPLQPVNEPERAFQFDDLAPRLRDVLRVQLQKPGDVSAVIETPTGFLLFAARDKTAGTLNAAALSIPKRGFDQWLAAQKE